MRITRNLLFFIFAACLLIPSFSTPYQASAKDTPIDFFNLELPLIDDEIKSSLEKYGEGLELNNGLAIFRKKTGQTGKINISISNLTKQDNYYSIDGIVTVHLNNDVIQFDFKQQYLYVVESSPGHIIYYYDIDSKYFDGKKNRMSSILAVTIPSQDKEYASITVGELGSEGIFLLEFGERYITDTLEETLYNSMSNEIISNYVQPDDANIQSTVDWGEYTYKATVETAFADDYDYWGRAAVLSIGRKYVENCSCGEVVLRAFAPVEDVQNETNDTVFPNKIKMGVQHHDGQVNNAYPQASSSSSGNTIIYDLLNVSGVPTNTLQAIANGFTATISHIDGNSGEPQDMAVEYYRASGLSSSVYLPASVLTDDVENEYNGVKRGATAYFNILNYDDYATVKSYAQVRYRGRAVNGQFYDYWSNEAYAHHYVNQ